jgi:hypothetical protein
MTRKITPADRLKALVKSLTASLTDGGPPLADDEAAFVKLAAAAMIRGDAIAEAVGKGEEVDDSELVRLLNVSQRTMRELRDERARRASATSVSASGMTPMQEYLASVAARKAARAAEPVEDDDDEVELHPAIAAFAARQAEQRGKPIETEVEFGTRSEFARPDPEVEPAKPQGKVEIWLDGHSGPTGQTLLEAVQTLRARDVKTFTLTTPATSGERQISDELIAGFNGVGPLAGRRQWFIRGI